MRITAATTDFCTSTGNVAATPKLLVGAGAAIGDHHQHGGQFSLSVGRNTRGGVGIFLSTPRRNG